LKIVDEEPQAWYLARQAEALLLDINCSSSAVSYSFMIALTPQEAAQYRSKGREYINWLAQDIADSAPGMAGSLSPYKGRDVSNLHSKKFNAAVTAWQASIEQNVPGENHGKSLDPRWSTEN
jgi:hypothetical protein